MNLPTRKKARASRRQGGARVGGSRQAFRPTGPWSSTQVVRQSRSLVSLGSSALPVRGRGTEIVWATGSQRPAWSARRSGSEDEMTEPQTEADTRDCEWQLSAAGANSSPWVFPFKNKSAKTSGLFGRRVAGRRPHPGTRCLPGSSARVPAASAEWAFASMYQHALEATPGRGESPSWQFCRAS